VIVDKTGKFSILDMKGNGVRGDIWVNLKDQTLNFKSSKLKSNDYYGTYEPPSTITIVNQLNGNEKTLTKI